MWREGGEGESVRGGRGECGEGGEEREMERWSRVRRREVEEGSGRDGKCEGGGGGGGGGERERGG